MAFSNDRYKQSPINLAKDILNMCVERIFKNPQSSILVSQLVFKYRTTVKKQVEDIVPQLIPIKVGHLFTYLKSMILDYICFLSGLRFSTQVQQKAHMSGIAECRIKLYAFTTNPSLVLTVLNATKKLCHLVDHLYKYVLTHLLAVMISTTQELAITSALDYFCQ